MPKTKTTKIPKRIAGVKLPKELRKAGNAVLEKVNSPQGREMLAAGLTMAAAAATAAVAKSRAEAAKPAAAGAAEGEAKAKAAPTDPMAFANTLGGMAEAAIGKFFAAGKSSGPH